MAGGLPKLLSERSDFRNRQHLRWWLDAGRRPRSLACYRRRSSTAAQTSRSTFIGTAASRRTIPTLVGSTLQAPYAERGTSGPSPLPWGERRKFSLAELSGRTIPTPVGSTRLYPYPIAGAPDHPHACGEHSMATL